MSSKKKSQQAMGPSKNLAMDLTTRRQFISNSSKLALAVAATSAGCTTLGRSISSLSTSGREEFDYIVVGSGAGGGPVAANLAKAGYRVLLLEAGGNRGGRNYSVPGFDALSTEDKDMAWHFYVKHYQDVQRQKLNPKYVENKGILYPRAGTLGGCTAHNDMIILYPDSNDWDQIAKLTQDSSWQGVGMRRYFERVENCQYVKKNPLNAGHGYEGWLPTEIPRRSLAFRDFKVLDLVLNSSVKGALVRKDANDAKFMANRRNGLYTIPQSTLNGVRRGTRELILDTLKSHSEKLTLRTDAFVTEILFNDLDRTKAEGIEYQLGSNLYSADLESSSQKIASSKKFRAFAKREIILCGGVFNSPQLLMLSGIGDATHLQQMGIRPRVNLPGVGLNLQDRYEVSIPTHIRGDFSILKDCTFGEGNDPCLTDYDRNPRSSPYGTNGVFTSFIRRSAATKIDPDLCIFGIIGRFEGYFPGWSKKVIAKDQFSWVVLKGKTVNRAGSVRLKSKSPFETPDINFRYFDESNDRTGEDLSAVVEGVRFARSLNRKLLAKLVVKGEDLPAAALQSDDNMKEHIKNRAWGHHASCTNRIGAEGEPGAVLDSKFRVQGIKNLRVVDASVFPRIPGLFIVASVYMIAEKASDEILKAALET